MSKLFKNFFTALLISCLFLYNYFDGLTKFSDLIKIFNTSAKSFFQCAENIAKSTYAKLKDKKVQAHK